MGGRDGGNVVMAMETLNTLTTQGRHQLIVMGGQRDKQPLRYTHTHHTHR